MDGLEQEENPWGGHDPYNNGSTELPTYLQSFGLRWRFPYLSLVSAQCALGVWMVASHEPPPLGPGEHPLTTPRCAKLLFLRTSTEPSHPAWQRLFGAHQPFSGLLAGCHDVDGVSGVVACSRNPLHTTNLPLAAQT